MRYFATLATILLITIFSITIFGGEPETINYQGRLTDSFGNPVADAAYQVTFIIWDDSVDSEAANEKWNSGMRTVNTVDGIFRYRLGSNVIIPGNVFYNNDDLYLGITVEPDSEITPRTELNSTGYAFFARRADTAEVTLGVADNSITSSHIAPNAVGTSEIADNSITATDLANNSVGSAEIASDAVGGTEIRSGAVGSSEVADNSLTAIDLASSSVGTFEIADGAVGTSDIQPGAVGTNEVTDNSLTRTDIFDESGVAQFATSSPVVISVDANTVISSESITCPASGYILAIASLQAVFTHQIGTTSIYTFGLSQSTAFPTAQGKDIWISSGWPSGSVSQIVSANHIFVIAGAGTYTINLLGARSSGSPNYTILDRTITLAYFPTAYGTITLSPPSPEEDETVK